VRAGRPVRLRVTLVARDAAGNATRRHVAIKLRR
jgi:hypothetical protein